MTPGAPVGGRPGVCLLNLGCRVNRVELDLMASELEAAGAVLVDEAEADAIVVNTCAVTGEAEAKTRKAVRRAAGMPKAPAVVATGCVASLFSAELSELAPNVVVEANKSLVAGRVLDLLGLAAGSVTDEGGLVATPTPTAPHPSRRQDPGRLRQPLHLLHRLEGPRERPLAFARRGPRGHPSRAGQGRPRGRAHGHQPGQLPLGARRAPVLRLPGLLDLIMEKTDVERVRLSSIEPPDVTPELCDAMARGGERVAPFLHVCLQSGSDRTLRRMARVYRTDLFRRAVEEARSLVPRLALGTDLIVGFPGETDEDFADSLAFCEEMRFAKMHVFRYSRRPGTPAADFPDQVDPHVMAARGARMRELAGRMRRDEAAGLVGVDDLVVVQYPGRGVSGGLFDVRVPEEVPLDTLLPVRLF